MATGETTDYSSDDPPGAPSALLPDHERIVSSWFEYEMTFWAWQRVHDLVDNDPDVAWRVLVSAIEQAEDDGALEVIAPARLRTCSVSTVPCLSIGLKPAPVSIGGFGNP
jgi:hypothetical protein